MNCSRCDIELDEKKIKDREIHKSHSGKYILCNSCNAQLQYLLTKNINPLIDEFIQPERSKREEAHHCAMRCSEHCGNTVRDK